MCCSLTRNGAFTFYSYRDSKIGWDNLKFLVQDTTGI